VTRLSALIVDDERLARSELRRLLGAHPEIEVVDEADGAQAALERIEALRPQVVFLDVQMPVMNGFELLDRTEAAFQTVFVTAYDEHALRAFDVNALDYLLKPVNPERLARCVARLCGRLPAEAAPAAARPPLGPDDHLFLGDGRRARFVRVRAIACLTSAGDYTEVTTGDGQRLLTNAPLREWDERLPERLFARIHRTAIVNLERVERVEPAGEDSYRVFLEGLAQPFPMSRRQTARLRAKLG
jgi:two-component system LytT family response regulator